MMIAKKVLLLVSLMTGSCLASYAQYDDDIYYNPAKSKKTQTTTVKKSSARSTSAGSAANNAYNGYGVSGNSNGGSTYNYNLGGADYAPADSYQVAGTSTRDVDEYNRRGAYSQNDSAAGISEQPEDYKYTRRIEKYYNEDIIADVNDPAIVESYYSSAPDVTINVISPGYGWYSPWWYWNDPWYWNSWGPSWSWNWGWGPSWSWGWGPSWAWNWGWGPSWSWGPAWGPVWGPAWGGTYRPHHYTANGRRPGTGIRNGYTGTRPGSSSRPSYSNGSVGNYRPGSSATQSRPSVNYNQNQNGSTYRPSNSQSTTGNRTTGNRSGYNNSTSRSYNNSGSFNSSRSSGSSRGSFGGAGRGGGGHRGGRR